MTKRDQTKVTPLRQEVENEEESDELSRLSDRDIALRQEIESDEESEELARLKDRP